MVGYYYPWSKIDVVTLLGHIGEACAFAINPSSHGYKKGGE